MMNQNLLNKLLIILFNFLSVHTFKLAENCVANCKSLHPAVKTIAVCSV